MPGAQLAPTSAFSAPPSFPASFPWPWLLRDSRIPRSPNLFAPFRGPGRLLFSDPTLSGRLVLAPAAVMGISSDTSRGHRGGGRRGTERVVGGICPPDAQRAPRAACLSARGRVRGVVGASTGLQGRGWTQQGLLARGGSLPVLTKGPGAGRLVSPPPPSGSGKLM